MEDRKVNILGTEYDFLIQSTSNNPKLEECNGLCEQYSKKIIISDLEEVKKDVLCVEKLQEFKKKVARHEVIHAFLGESGLRGNSLWAENEEMVDWFAIQFPKILEVFKELGVL